MKANTASRTAQYMAFFRALENALTEYKRLFTDNYATLCLDAGLQLAAKVSTWPLAGGFIYWLANNRGPGALSSGIARTRYIDDLLHREIEKGIKPSIIPGAGFDTRAMRLAFLKQIPVIEIDHPDTSDFKSRS